jgi:hypothetical protein
MKHKTLLLAASLFVGLFSCGDEDPKPNGVPCDTVHTKQVGWLCGDGTKVYDSSNGCVNNGGVKGTLCVKP